MLVPTALVGCEGCGSSNGDVACVTRDYSFETCTNDFTYINCNCGLIYLQNRPVSEALDTIYPTNYVAYQPFRDGLVSMIRRRNFLGKYRLMSQYLREGDGILDYGCGSGEFLAAVASTDHFGGVLYGADFSALAAPLLAKIGARFMSPNLSTIEPDAPLGALVMNQVIEHLAEPRVVLRQVAGLLRPAGIFYIETPSPTGWDFRLGKGGLWGGWHAPRHFFVFTKESLTRLLEEAGFRILRVDFFPSPFLWAETIRAKLRARPLLVRFADLSSIKNPFALPFLTLPDMLQGALSRPTSNLRIVAQRI